jgi:hypothetical protein
MADRWTSLYGGATPVTVSATQQPFTPADLVSIGYGEGSFFFRNTMTDKGAATSLRIETYIEDVRTLAGQTATVSFYAKGAVTSANIRCYFLQAFGSGGSASTFTSPAQGAGSLTSSWQRFSFTFTVPSITGKTIGAGSNLTLRIQSESITNGDVIDIWGVQVEAGSVATPFRRNANSIQGELAACLRYFERLQGGIGAVVGAAQARSGTDLETFISFAPKRTFPTYSASSTTYRARGDGSTTRTVTFSSFEATTHVSEGNQAGIAARINVTGSFTQGYAYHLCFAASGQYLDLSAEL